MAIPKIIEHYDWNEIIDCLRNNSLADIPTDALPIIADIIDIYVVQSDINTSSKPGPNPNTLAGKKRRLLDRLIARALDEKVASGMSKQDAEEKIAELVFRSIKKVQAVFTKRNNGRLDYATIRVFDYYETMVVKLLFDSILKSSDSYEHALQNTVTALNNTSYKYPDDVLRQIDNINIDVSDLAALAACNNDLDVINLIYAAIAKIKSQPNNSRN